MTTWRDVRWLLLPMLLMSGAVHGCLLGHNPDLPTVDRGGDGDASGETDFEPPGTTGLGDTGPSDSGTGDSGLDVGGTGGFAQSLSCDEPVGGQGGTAPSGCGGAP